MKLSVPRRLRRWCTLLLVALLPLAGACAPTFRTGGALRLEQLQSDGTAAQQQLRADGRASASVRGDAGTVTLAVSPTALMPLAGAAAARTVLRTELEAAGDPRDRLQPRLNLGAERGRTRTVELAAESLDPRPTVDALTTERLSASAALRIRQEPRRLLTFQADLSRNGGVGGDAGALPQLQRAALSLERRATLDSRRTLTWRVGGESLQRDTDAPWRSVRADVEWTNLLRRRDRLTLGLGLVQGLDSARADVRMVLAWRHSSRPGALAWEGALEQAPELDRLDGRLRTRRRARLTMEAARVSGVSFRGTLQGLTDAATTNARRGLSAELGLRQPLTEFATLDVDVAQVLLWEGQATQRAETRAAVGIRIPIR